MSELIADCKELDVPNLDVLLAFSRTVDEHEGDCSEAIRLGMRAAKRSLAAETAKMMNCFIECGTTSTH
eukprot:6481226-Amphidinium_carterae.1